MNTKCVDCGKELSGGLDTFGPIDEPRCRECYMAETAKRPEPSLIKIIVGDYMDRVLL